MKFAVMSDIHYISPEMIVNDERAAFESAVSRQAIMDVASREDIDTILITGDITDSGDKLSHLGMVELLRSVKAMGKRVYVTTATHDFGHHKAYIRKKGDTEAQFASSPWSMPYFDKDNADFPGYLKPEFKGMPSEKATPMLEECYAPEELWDLYREFGRDDACSADNGSYSYCIDLDDSTRCLMLNDNFRNEEALKDKSVTYSPKCLRWIARMVKEAKEQGKFIFACTHHPLVPPSPAYRIGASNRDMRSPYSAHVLADIGINLVFSGHSHFTDVAFAESEHGNTLCDITTPSVRFYPPRYRIVELDGKNGRVAYSTVPVSVPEGMDIGNVPLEAFYRTSMYNEYYSKMLRLKKPLNNFVTEKKVSSFYFLIRHTAKLSNEEYDAVKDIKFFDLVINAVFNMLTGDGGYTPDTPEYKVLMSLAAVLDSVIDAQPFIDVRKKYLKGYTVKQVVEPLCFNNFVPDNEAEIDFTKKPTGKVSSPVFTSHAGGILMTVICILAVPLSVFLPPAAIIGIPAAAISKKKRLADNPPKPNDIY